MNGRVYDPLTAMFFSPDPYVQAPDNWLNYNRYGYCYGNPFKYTDPSGNLQLGPFYFSINIGISKQGGLTFGISAGVGLEDCFSVGVSINYGFKNSNWSFSFSASASGAYAYVGYDTKAGWIEGSGYAIPSPFSIWSPVNVSTNMLSIGSDYSEHGGTSVNVFGMNISKNGLSFNPSVEASTTFMFGKTVHLSEPINQDSSEKPFPGGQNQFEEWVDNNIDRNDFGLDKASIVEDPNTNVGDYKYWRNPNDGLLYEINLKTHSFRLIGGLTVVKYNGWGGRSNIYVNNSGSCEVFTGIFDHELIHAFHYSLFLNQSLREKFNSYTEHIAYQFYYDNGFRSPAVIYNLNSTTTGIYTTYMPSYLISIK
jgi:hypothetical protein